MHPEPCLCAWFGMFVFIDINHVLFPAVGKGEYPQASYD